MSQALLTDSNRWPLLAAMWDSWRWSHHGSWLAEACLRSALAVLSTYAVGVDQRFRELAPIAGWAGGAVQQ
jgi:hypothetical protein